MSKKLISIEEFEKQVEIEYSFLLYFAGMKKDDAWKKSRVVISELYEFITK